MHRGRGYWSYAEQGDLGCVPRRGDVGCVLYLIRDYCIGGRNTLRRQERMAVVFRRQLFIG